MKFEKFSNRSTWLAGVALACLSVVGMVSCGGGGGSATGSGGLVPAAHVQLRPLPAEFTSRAAVSYAPFRTSNKGTELAGLATQSNSAAMDANILADLQKLSAGKINLIRLFATDTPLDNSGVPLPNVEGVASRILRIIQSNSLDIKVQLGIWITGNATLDNAEIARGVALAKAYPSIVLAVSVGNEMMVNWSYNLAPSLIAGYITTVRNQITQPVTSDDDWAFWSQANGNGASPVPVLDVVDFVSMHSYPMSESEYNQWDWKQSGVANASTPVAGVADPRAQAMMAAALTRIKLDYSLVRANLDGRGRNDLPITIGETGWRAVNTYSPDMAYRASSVNQAMYYTAMNDWLHTVRTGGSGPANIFYFEAFDEPWKAGDDKWGLFNKDRQARCAVQGLSATFTAEPSISCAASDAVYWKPPVVQTVAATKQYTLYADDRTTAPLTNGTTPPSLGWFWGGTPGEVTMTLWAGVAVTEQAGTGDPVSSAETAHYLKFVPDASTNWGWGGTMILNPISPNLFEAADLSQMGSLNFSIKTSYLGNLEVGFVTGRGSDSSSYEVMMPIASGQYGFVNDGAWHEVKIPLSVLQAAAVAKFGVVNQYHNSIDLTKVTQPFILADRYANTNNAPGQKSEIDIDRIFWSAN